MTDDWKPAGRLTFGALLDRQAEAFGDKPFLWIDDRCITFADARRPAVAAADSWLALGLRPGDTVALFAGTCPEWVDAFFGAALAGLRTVPLNLAYRASSSATCSSRPRVRRCSPTRRSARSSRRPSPTRTMSAS